MPTSRRGTGLTTTLRVEVIGMVPIVSVGEGPDWDRHDVDHWENHTDVPW